MELHLSPTKVTHTRVLLQYSHLALAPDISLLFVSFLHHHPSFCVILVFGYIISFFKIIFFFYRIKKIIITLSVVF